MQKNILIFGKNGQLAQSLKQSIKQHHCLFLGRNECDLLDQRDIKKHILSFKPDVIVNSAAYTAVDLAEAEQEDAFLLNRDAPHNMAQIAAEYHIPLIHISTDFVFDGEKKTPYLPADKVNPLGIYGQSKYEGEQAILKAHNNAIIIRTSWVFSPFGNNFVKTMLRLGCQKDVLNIVSDQIGCPTSALDLAKDIMQIIEKKSDFKKLEDKVFHYSGEDSLSWYEFAKIIFSYADDAGLKIPSSIIPILAKDYKTAAKRPAYSVMDTQSFTKTFDIPMKSWKIALKEMIINHEEAE